MEELASELLKELNCDTAFSIKLPAGLPLIGGVQLDIAESVVITWVVMAVILILSIILTSNLKVHNVSRRQLVAETIVTKLEGIVTGMIGEEGKRYVPYLVSVLLYLGHGTSHTAKVSYSQMQTQMNELGYENVFIGTVEGEPEETACEEVIKAVAEAGYTKVVLRPLMVVAGDHANNDMAGEDEDSWLSQFNASGKFDSVDTQISGLGGIKAIQDLYVAHTAAAMAEK